MLSVISTPIGNLGDITLRAIETLKACDAVVCEDTRVAGLLLQKLEIPKKQLLSLHGYSNPRALDTIVERLQRGEHLALTSDAGTPGISDPGFVLVSRCAEEGIPIAAIPGPSAFLAALSVSGLPINRFRYLGFLPLKKGRKTLIASFADIDDTIVFYESVHRIHKTLHELADALAIQPQRSIVIARELTKLHEQVTRTTVAHLTTVAETLTQKGEFVVIVGAKERHSAQDDA